MMIRKRNDIDEQLPPLYTEAPTGPIEIGRRAQELAAYTPVARQMGRARVCPLFVVRENVPACLYGGPCTGNRDEHRACDRYRFVEARLMSPM